MEETSKIAKETFVCKNSPKLYVKIQDHTLCDTETLEYV